LIPGNCPSFKDNNDAHAKNAIEVETKLGYIAINDKLALDAIEAETIAIGRANKSLHQVDPMLTEVESRSTPG